jgi:resuscitation-promoting factor RpfB
MGFVALAVGPMIVVLTTSHQAPIAASPVSHRTAASGVPAARLVAAEAILRARAPAPDPPPPPTKAKPPAAAPARRAAAIPPSSVGGGTVVGIIRAAAARWGVSGDWMVSIARCESGLRPNAYNPSGPYYGLFQFLMSTFRANGGTNIWSASDQANIAAKMLAHGQAHQWSCA